MMTDNHCDHHFSERGAWTPLFLLWPMSAVGDQYGAMMMIATTMNAATSERTRSIVFDLGIVAAPGGGISYVGGCNSPTSQPTSPDFIGSDAIAICST
jgi:hypothetical protein